MSDVVKSDGLTDKEKADIYLKLADRARERYESLRNLEWKLNIGLWTLLAAGTALIVTAEPFTFWGAAVFCIGGAIASLGIVWLFGVKWLPYIHGVCYRDNGASYRYEYKTREIQGLDVLPEQLLPKQHREWAFGDVPQKERSFDDNAWFWKKWHGCHPMFLAVTALLATMFVGSLGYKWIEAWERSQAATAAAQITIDGGQLEVD
ncbi:MAG TPA: hypothetical protein VE890_11510 [Thermoguttaceae bacterium]|nr:hypothetical protein [Thermoguttaceae bacterium]